MPGETTLFSDWPEAEAELLREALAREETRTAKANFFSELEEVLDRPHSDCLDLSDKKALEKSIEETQDLVETIRRKLRNLEVKVIDLELELKRKETKTP